MELSIIDKKLAMDSRDIAKLTHKKHNIVMRDIREINVRNQYMKNEAGAVIEIEPIKE